MIRPLLCAHHLAVFDHLRQRFPHMPRAERRERRRIIAGQCPACIALTTRPRERRNEETT